MNNHAINSKSVFGPSMRFIGAILIIALMRPEIVFSQSAVNPGNTDYVPGIVFSEPTVDLGTAASFTVLAAAGITNTGPSVLNGDIGSYPTATIIGFPPGTFTGTNHGDDLTTQQAMVDLAAAYTDAAGRVGAITVGTELGGTTLTPGVYKSDAGTFGITGTLTLDAQCQDAVFIFQMASTLTTADNSNVVLLSGAQWSKIFWQVGSSATLGANSSLEGSVLANTSITATSGASVHGRMLAGAVALSGAVTLDNNISLSSALTDVIEVNAGQTPGGFLLNQNYPNPFNPSTKIRFALNKQGMVTLKIFDTLGNEISTLINEIKSAGEYEVDFNAKDLTSNVYFYTLKSNEFSQTKKMLILK